MLRCVLFLAVAVLPLSCATSGQSSDSRTITYQVSCPSVCRVFLLDSEGKTEVYIREGSDYWNLWHFKPGQRASLTVERTNPRGGITAYIYDGPIVAADTLRRGEVGPLTLEYIVE